MEISRVIEDKITILELSGNLLGEKDANPILEAVDISLGQNSNQFVIDLSGMKYINSTGLSVLLNIRNSSQLEHAPAPAFLFFAAKSVELLSQLK